MVQAEDLGGIVVAGVRQRLEAGGASAGHWGRRGFEVLHFGRRQRVWSDPAARAGERARWRIQVRTGFLRQFGPLPAQIGALGLEMSRPSLSGVVRSVEDPSRLELATTLHVDASNRGWAIDFLTRAARLQAAEAAALARQSALVSAGAAADTACGAVAGGWDAGTPLDALRACPVPGYACWAAGELAECLPVLASVPFARWAASDRGLCGSFAAEAPWLSGGPSLLEMSAGVEAHGLGAGLSVRLTMPRAGGVEDALVLNEREAAPGGQTDLLGGWSADEGVLQHTAFFPNLVYASDLALHVALGAAIRARWARGWPPRSAPASLEE